MQEMTEVLRGQGLLLVVPRKVRESDESRPRKEGSKDGMADRKKPEKRQKDEGDGRRRRGIADSVKPPISSKLADSVGNTAPRSLPPQNRRD
jgi:hypothetical protein